MNSFPAFTLRDGTTTYDPRLDYIRERDPKSLDEFPASAAPGVHQSYGDLRSALLPILTRGWSVKRWLDQQRQGACVLFSFHHWLLATPQRSNLYQLPVSSVESLARTRYWDVQREDPYPGGEYPGADPQSGGTSPLSAAKYLQRLGYFDSYHWAESLNDILRAITWEGPVLMASDWYEGMYEPGSDGYVRPEGDVVGGHQYLLSSHSVGSRRATIWNSWGEDWGNRGRAFISYDDLERLLFQDGECCIPSVKRTGPPVS